MNTPWTQFMDMHSGGGSKEPQEYIYIQAPEKEAEVIFYNRFGHNPHRITCTCCGNDYSISEYKTLEEATDYQRQGMLLEEYVKISKILIIPEEQIKPEERSGELPQQGYVWID